ncbi:MAG: phosphatase PAP2 family protein [Burkholderiales bacterium]|nr:phosphatase PAP2 family protein [Burkholderiales bacterium]
MSACWLRLNRLRRGGVMVLLAILLVGGSSECLAWAAPGHQIVGATADELLAGTRAEREVRRILGGMDLKTVSVWADCARGVSQSSPHVFIYSSSDDAYPECSIFNSREWALRMINYARANWNECKLASGSEMCHSQFHYTDVSTFEAEYKDGEPGTSKVDIVHAIPEAIRVLRGDTTTPTAAPRLMIYPTQLEALMALTHFVGDIHQPLHVAALYLDANGNPIDPEHVTAWASASTAGGNFVRGNWAGVGNMNWHAYWDSIPEDLVPGGPAYRSIVDRAKQVPVSTGDAIGWATLWANDTINAGKPAFAGLSFAPVKDFDPKKPQWTVQQPVGYEQTALGIKREQLAKAGARLAQVLQAIWPDPEVVCNAGASGHAKYLGKATIARLTHDIPPAPGAGSAVQLGDDRAFEATRMALLTPRGRVAAHDDVYAPNEVLPRFSEALGTDLAQRNLQPLYDLLAAARNDADQVMNPVKKPVCNGGRIRPFVAHPVALSCPSLVVTRFDDGVYDEALIAKWQSDLNVYHLDQTGSYPSGHAMTGELFADILAEIFPERAGQIHQRGVDFGESRLICGFHYPSDLKAGRDVADAVFRALKTNRAFEDQLRAVKAGLKVQ